MTAPTQIHIPLRQRDGIPENASDAVFNQISDEFSKKYLQALNVTPTVQNLQVVKKNLPLSTLLGAGVSASWNNGTIADAMTIKIHSNTPQDSEVSGTKQYGKKFLDVDLPKMNTLKEETSLPKPEETTTHFPKFSKYELPANQDTVRMVHGMEELRQKRIAGVATSDHQALQEQVKRENYARQLTILKRKFIIPFCAEIVSDRSSSSSYDEVERHRDEPIRVRQILSDDIPLTLNIPDHLIPVIQGSFDVSLEKLSIAICEFVDKDMPLELLARRRERHIGRLRKLLLSKEVVEVAGLCAHFLYWQCFGHYAVEGLPHESMEAVYCSVTDRWSALEESAKGGPHGLFHLSAVVLVLKWVVEWSFRKQYPQVVNAVSDDFLYRINLFFLRAFDRDFAVYSHFGSLDGSPHAMKLQSALKVKPNNYRASNIVQMLMSGDCTHSSTRALLMKSSKSSGSKGDVISKGSKSALYQIALRRCSGYKT